MSEVLTTVPLASGPADNQDPQDQLGRQHKQDLAAAGLEALSSSSRNPLAGRSPVIQVIDLFSGAGGMSLGFDGVAAARGHFRVLGGCDLDTQSAKTYSANLGVECLAGDVRELARDEKALQAFLDSVGYDPELPLVLVGCPPCQGFTAHRKKSWAQTDQRNGLVEDFADLAMRLRPECIVVENVPEFLSAKYWPHSSYARELWQGSGYRVHQAIYNAAAFGVPQNRFRAVMIAMEREFLMPKPALSPAQFRTVRDAIGELPPVLPGQPSPEDAMHRCAQHRASTLETIRAVPKDGGSRPAGVGPQCLDRVHGFYDVYGRLFWDRPSVTLTHYARNPASGRYVHPEQDRGLTMREVALLQTFPGWYQFAGSLDDVYRQIGEAVPPALACHVAADVLIEMLSSEPTHAEMAEAVPDVLEPVSNSFSSRIGGLKHQDVVS